MATKSTAMNVDRPVTAERTHSGLENILPAGIVKGTKSKLRSRPPPTPLLARSISSMTDSFVLDHRSLTRSPPGHDESNNLVEHASSEGDVLTPISNWAHLSYMKNQRNNLLAEFTASQVVGAEVKRSVTSLRRLAFRMAINISIKERQIATSARNLANSRQGHYLQGKDAEKRIEGLRRALSVEECRNRQIFEALERASMLTLEYSTPQPRARQHAHLFSPPPSPPSRTSNLPKSPLSSPRTPLRSIAWHEFDPEHTPTINTPSEICYSDSRLIRAKRESAQALTACRNRIDELQNECNINKENVDLLAATRKGLEQEIHGHHFRVASLERSRAAVESTLDLTRSQLQLATKSEVELEQQLHTRDAKLSDLEHNVNDKQQVINMLLGEKEMLEERLKSRNMKFRRLEIHTSALTHTLHALQGQLDSAEQHESTLRSRLAEKESAREDVRRRLEHGSNYIEILESKVKDYETESADHTQQAKHYETNMSILRDELDEAHHNNKNHSEALATIRTEVVSLQALWQEACHARDETKSELETSQAAKASVQEELRLIRKALQKETAAKDWFDTELKNLRALHDVVNANLQAAQTRLEFLEKADGKSQSKIEWLRDGKAALEADLVDARQTLFKLREELRMSTSELGAVQCAKSDLQQRLRQAEERAAALETTLEQTRTAAVVSEERYNSDFRKSNAQLGSLEDSVLDLKTELASSEEVKRSLEVKLHQAKSYKDLTERQFAEALRTQADLKSELEKTRSTFVSTEHDRARLQSKVDVLENEVEASLQVKAQLEDKLTLYSKENNTLDILVSGLEAALKEKSEAKIEVDNALAIAQTIGKSTRAELADMHDQLNNVNTAKEDAHSRLRDALSLQEDLETNHNNSLSKLANLEAEITNIQSQLCANQEEIVELRRAKIETEERLDATQHSYDTLKSKTELLGARLSIAELSVEKLDSDLVLAEEELGALHRDKAATKQRMSVILKINASLEKEVKTAQGTEADIESKLNDALDSGVRLETKLQVVTSEMDDLHAENAHLKSELSQTVEMLKNLQQHRSSIERKLDAALVITKTLEKELSLSRTHVQDAETQNTCIMTKLSEANKELVVIEAERTHLQDKLAQTGNNKPAATDNTTSMHTHLAEAKSNQEILASQLSNSEERCKQYRKAHFKLEEELQSASRRAEDLTADLRAAQMHLETARQEVFVAHAEFHKANKEIGALRESNVRLEASEKVLSSQLGSAEKNLSVVQESNTRLEAFLGRIEKDMRAAETAVTESETCLRKFVEESQAKIDAVRLDRLEYRRRLSLRNSELEILTDENSRLHKKIHAQIQDLGNSKEAREKLVQDLADKETYIAELGSSSEKRLKSMHSAYNELRKKHEYLQSTSRPSSARETSSNKQVPPASVAELEQKLRELEEDKRAFEIMVTKLKEKTRGLEVLRERQEVDAAVEPASPRHVTILGDSQRLVASSPLTLDLTSNKYGSRRCLPTTVSQPGVLGQRPGTRTSSRSHDGDFNAWGKEVEHLRSLIDATAIDLKGLKKSRFDLKKSLKDAEAQLRRLEKQQSPRRHRSLLRKSRPSTPFRLLAAQDHTLLPIPQVLPRPATSSGVPFSPHPQSTTRHGARLDSPTSAERTNTPPLHSEHRRWSLASRPMTSHRAGTSHSFKSSFNERLPESRNEFLLEQPKDGRRWSLGLRNLFSL